MEKIKCSVCGRDCDPSTALITIDCDGNIDLITCHNCSPQLGHCPTCIHAKRCGFMTDPDPTPHMVVVEQRQQIPMGYAIMQKQVPNPARIKKFCIDGQCPCMDESDPENLYCSKHSGCTTCTNYCEIKSNNFVEKATVKVENEN